MPQNSAFLPLSVGLSFTYVLQTVDHFRFSSGPVLNKARYSSTIWEAWGGGLLFCISELEELSGQFCYFN